MSPLADQLDVVLDRVVPPVVVVLGSVGGAITLAQRLADPNTICYQMDLYQAQRIREALATEGIPGRVETAPDLWDLPADFQTAVFPVSRSSERELKIDMVEQAFHVLRPGGSLMVLSPYSDDDLFPGHVKKVFGRRHERQTDDGKAIWAHREGDRPRRRHEVTFQVRVGDGPSARFLSRPGTFSYGRFDNGARALLEVAEIGDGDRILDLGCGCGTNGVFAAQRAGPEGQIALVDSNVRATALADLNAAANGVARYTVTASADGTGVPGDGFDAVLANPPYFAVDSIARLFIKRAKQLLRRHGQLYLVTRQPNTLAPLVADLFPHAEQVLNRGYTILVGTDEA